MLIVYLVNSNTHQWKPRILGLFPGYLGIEAHTFLHRNIEVEPYSVIQLVAFFTKNQSILTAIETIENKVLLERLALSAGAQIKSYCTDNGIYNSKEFLKELSNQEQESG